MNASLNHSTTAPRLVTSLVLDLAGQIQSADISDHGGLVAFHATMPNDPEPQVYVITRQGPRTRSVLVGNVVVELGTRRVLVGGDVIGVPGASPQRLTQDGSNVEPEFITGDDRIGFASDRLGPVSLWSMNIDGSDQRELLVATTN